MDNKDIKTAIDNIKIAFSEMAEDFKLLFKKDIPIQLGTAITKDGVILAFEGEKLVEGAEVTVEDASKTAQKAADGSYELENGDVIEIKDGKVLGVTEISKPTEDPQTIAEIKAAHVEFKTASEKATKELNDKITALELSITKIGETLPKILELSAKTVEVFETVAAQSPAPTEPLANRKLDFQNKQEDRLAAISTALKAQKANN